VTGTADRHAPTTPAWPLLFPILTVGCVNRYVIPIEEALLHAFGPARETCRTRIRRWI
jgi:hypothetical protein